jgi:hypothetical protein
MDFFDSKAAVDAMAALQARIRELEKNNAKVRKECARLKSVSETEEVGLNERETNLVAAADKAQKVLEGASETLIELRRVRHENKHLQAQLDGLQKQLSEKLDREERTKGSISKLTTRKQNIERLIAEYEALFCEVLSPPNFNLNGSGNVPFNNTTISVTTHSLPATLQTCIQMLQTLPFPFRDQKLEKKREIVAVLLNARDIACKMAEEIHRLEVEKLECGSVRRIQAEIDVKSSHLGLLCQAMSRFRFS